MQPRHYSQLYRRLRDLDPTDYQRVIRTYEEQENNLGRLDALEHFEITTYYADALFATGAYRQHLLMVDLVIEACIRENIHAVPDIEGDIFQHLLFKKAVSAFRLRKFDLAIHVARELVRINPGKPLYQRFLRLSLFKSSTNLLQFGRAAFVSCILAAALAITINLLVMTSFYPMYVTRVNLLVGSFFVTGFLLLIGTYGFTYWRAGYRARQFQNAQANK